MLYFQEYEEQKTLESVFVKDLDKFDMIFQAYEYEQLENKPGSLQEFFDSTSGKRAVLIFLSKIHALAELKTCPDFGMTLLIFLQKPKKKKNKKKQKQNKEKQKQNKEKQNQNKEKSM